MTRVSGSSRGRGCNLARRMCRQEKGGGGILSCFRFFDLPNGVHWVNGTDGNSTEGMYVPELVLTMYISRLTGLANIPQ